MREIKFRAWDGEKIVPQGALYWDGEKFVTGLWTHEETHIEHKYQVDIELMQYTGIKDKNGVEIYEGDIVRHWSCGYNDGGMGDKQVLSVVKWDEAGACFENCIDRRRGVEVVGNIYEHGHLLDSN